MFGDLHVGCCLRYCLCFKFGLSCLLVCCVLLVVCVGLGWLVIGCYFGWFGYTWFARYCRVVCLFTVLVIWLRLSVLGCCAAWLFACLSCFMLDFTLVVTCGFAWWICFCCYGCWTVCLCCFIVCDYWLIVVDIWLVGLIWFWLIIVFCFAFGLLVFVVFNW